MVIKRLRTGKSGDGLEEIVSVFGAYISDYGYLALFGLFFLGILGMPLPEATLLAFAGFLVSSGQLDFWPTLLVCYAGSITAMTVAYWIGRVLGFSLIERYGKRLGFVYGVYLKTASWFERFGKWALPIGYFFTGIRQFTAYFAGITRLPFPTFLLYTYTGGFIWSLLYVVLGWQLGERWEVAYNWVSQYRSYFALVVLVIVFLVVYLYQRGILKKPKREESS
jgi:membrane protein DedA with SNARE-associated domain